MRYHESIFSKSFASTFAKLYNFSVFCKRTIIVYISSNESIFKKSFNLICVTVEVE